MAFLDDLGTRLAAQGVGVVGSTIFKGSKARLPSLDEPNGEGPFITLIETGGMQPLFVHNYNAPHVSRPTAQVGVRAINYLAARNKSKAAWDALHIWRTAISGVMYMKIIARQEPTDAGLDAVGRVMIVFNVEADKQVS